MINRKITQNNKLNNSLEKEIHKLQQQINDINFTDKSILDISEKELLDYYTKKWEKNYLECQIKKLQLKEIGIDLLINFIDPPKSIEQALLLREQELNCKSLKELFDPEILEDVENEMSYLENEIKDIWD